MRSKPRSLAVEVPLDLIDPPARAMREHMDHEKLAELAQSIATVGLVLPIVLIQIEGGRYEIADGHRRYVASGLAEKKTIPAVIREPGGPPVEAIKVAANLFREDVNPVEEAGFYSVLLEQDAGGDVIRLCEMYSLPQARVEDRLNLLKGDPEILAALRAEAISLACARELNKAEPRNLRLTFLEAAITGGASARLVAQWRADAVKAGVSDALAHSNGENQFTPQSAAVTERACVVCSDTHAPWDFEYLVVHKTNCRRMLDRAMKPIREALGELKGTDSKDAVSGTANGSSAHDESPASP